MTYSHALDRLRTVLNATLAGGDLELQEILDSREPVLARFGPVFSPDRIPQLTADEFRSFLQFDQNHHWTGINRWATALTSDMGRLRSSLALLLNEAIPIRARVDAVLGNNGEARIEGLGKAVVTPILLVSRPDRYGVWNQPSESGMKALGIWPADGRGLTEGERYERVNELLLRVANDLGIDLWTLDALWWRIVSVRPGSVSGAALPVVTEDEYVSAMDTLAEPVFPGSLDERREAAVRVEQQFLREALFRGRKVEKCVLCGREFPVDLLRAAHVKRRADCSREEKLDYRNNVVPMCTFGCDELFERGYVIVREGHVARGTKAQMTPAVEEYLGRILDRPCLPFYRGSRAYFEAHAGTHG
jgi:hypothetical protein